jgi:hypothetical protein
MSASLLKSNLIKKAPNPRPSAPTNSLPTGSSTSEVSYSQKLEEALAVESLVRQITEWDTICNE